MKEAHVSSIEVPCETTKSLQYGLETLCKLNHYEIDLGYNACVEY